MIAQEDHSDKETVPVPPPVTTAIRPLTANKSGTAGEDMAVLSALQRSNEASYEVEELLAVGGVPSVSRHT